jgi:hypothetical protein
LLPLTAQQLLLVAQLMPKNVPPGPLNTVDHVAPPSWVATMMVPNASPPAAMQDWVELQLTLLNPWLVCEFSRYQPLVGPGSVPTAEAVIDCGLPGASS